MESVDILLHARWIIPVEPDNLVHEHHSLAIKDGRIHAIAPTRAARNRYRAEVEVELADQRRNFVTMKGRATVDGKLVCEIEATAALVQKEDI